MYSGFNSALSSFINHITDSNDSFDRLKRYIKKYKRLNLAGLTPSARGLVIAYLSNNMDRPVLVLSPSISTALRYSNELGELCKKEIKYFPGEEYSPYEMIYSDPAILKDQLEILRGLKEGFSGIISASVKTLMSTFIPFDKLHKNSIYISLGQNIDPLKLAESLVKLGYTRTGKILAAGEFSLRGDILDIYPVSADPIRIEFFGDEIESIRVINIDTQRSVKQVSSSIIEPRYKIIFTDEAKNKLYGYIKNILEKSENEVLRLSLEEILSAPESYFEGIEYFSPVINEKLEDIIDYLPYNTLVVVHESTEFEHKLFSQDEKYKEEYQRNISNGITPELPLLSHIEPDKILTKLNNFDRVNIDSFIHEDSELTETIDCTLVPKFFGNLDNAGVYISNLRHEGKNTVIITEYPDRVGYILNNYECPFVLIDDKPDFDIEKLVKSKDVIISRRGFSEGFILPEINLAIITDSELFNKKIKKPTISKNLTKRENLDFLLSINDLKPGDYVVHANHGIGKFSGMSKQNIDGFEKDYLTIEYAGSDRLHMPAEQINMLSRYRGAGAPPKISRMGGAEWEGVKKKVKNAIRNIAQDLLNLYAKRAKSTGFIFEQDTPWQIEMENAFDYTETPDQMQAIIDVKSDMESEKPMDRLICGDVGFGKTEVAIRAVFKAILSGRQAAVLVPTTILAQQHFNTFVERFSPYPVKIELLSRFRKPSEQKQTVKRLMTGDCDFVVGTHRLLQQDIEFKNLGLVVIDEEHRFGVAHKEKLKSFRAEVDVLNLSATPIPRTLYMSLSGVRDMSLINTPPVNRAPVKTYVGEHNNSIVRTAICHELEREGQVYYLHNRVQSIYKVASDLQNLVPDAKIAVAHGQMNEKELEKVMYEFSTQQYDILVCTTIIESGLDIPSVNTIIIDDADRFGLAQLYQLRGRVGRSEIQAYAYCFYRMGKELTKESSDRLKAIKDFTTLGSGYQIALRDLEIRGVGNILGAQQHGHMISVGFDLYCSLLEESILELQNQKVSRKDPPVVDINITAFIPDEWVGDVDQKMIEYKRLADVASLRELEIIQEEWKDRFGEIPVEVKRLFKIIRIRLIGAEVGINLIRESDGITRIFTDFDLNEWKLYQNKLPASISKRLKSVKAPVSSKNGNSIIILNNSGLLSEERLNILEELISQILKLK